MPTPQEIQAWLAQREVRATPRNANIAAQIMAANQVAESGDKGNASQLDASERINALYDQLNQRSMGGNGGGRRAATPPAPAAPGQGRGDPTPPMSPANDTGGAPHPAPTPAQTPALTQDDLDRQRATGDAFAPSPSDVRAAGGEGGSWLIPALTAALGAAAMRGGGGSRGGVPVPIPPAPAGGVPATAAQPSVVTPLNGRPVPSAPVPVLPSPAPQTALPAPPRQLPPPAASSGPVPIPPMPPAPGGAAVQVPASAVPQAGPPRMTPPNVPNASAIGPQQSIMRIPQATALQQALINAQLSRTAGPRVQGRPTPSQATQATRAPGVVRTPRGGVGGGSQAGRRVGRQGSITDSPWNFGDPQMFTLR